MSDNTMYAAESDSTSTTSEEVPDYGNFSFKEPSTSQFKFPPPPRLVKSANNSIDLSLGSDSSNSTVSLNKVKKKKWKNGYAKNLPPLGIFWDIENCNVPKFKSASCVVQRMRQVFLENYREAEFVVVCDVIKENANIIQELHDSQVNLIHVASISKNAADEKLRQILRRFAEVYPAPSCVVLISSDINFAADLSDIRYRKKIRVILVHNTNVADALILCANEHHLFTELLQGLPSGRRKAVVSSAVFLTITNLPKNFGIDKLKKRLHILTNNCGGKCVEYISSEGVAHMKFLNYDLALRAQRRIQGEDVYGNRIRVQPPSIRSYSGSRLTNMETSYQSNESALGYPVPRSIPPGFGYVDHNNLGEARGISPDVVPFPSFLPKENMQFQHVRNMGGNIAPTDLNYERFQLSQESIPLNSMTSSTDSDEGAYQRDKFSTNSVSNQPVDLHISNLDHNIHVKELKVLLANMIKEYAMILNIQIMPTQSEGCRSAVVRVRNHQEAQVVISQLQKQKLGNKKITISNTQKQAIDPGQLRVMVISILQQVPRCQMALSIFLELFQSKYLYSVSVSEISKLKDIIDITENGSIRVISLTHKVRLSPSPNLSTSILPYCVMHCPNGMQNAGWCELYQGVVPNLIFPLDVFTAKVVKLLNVHAGSMPLLSFQACYEYEFKEKLPIRPYGVNLEHLVTCVPDVKIVFMGPNNNIKLIKQEVEEYQDEEEESQTRNIPESLASNLFRFRREIVELLKASYRCQLSFKKFIPTYHRHFGKQCRVADYGYLRLLDLFDSISHVVQVMGDGDKKIITLTHKAQMRRFRFEILRILRNQPAKQVSLKDFPDVYERTMNKLFDAADYGLCFLDDLIKQLPETMIVVNNTEEGVMISVPKQEQSPQQVFKTKQFASEVIQLLSHLPYFMMPFEKFVPSYHHNFRQQCRVSDYGFTKLNDLFQAIPEVVEVRDLEDGTRVVVLTPDQSLKILGTQLVQIFKNAQVSSIKIIDLPFMYLQYYGFLLNPKMFDCVTTVQVLEKLPDYVEVIRSTMGIFIVPVIMEESADVLRMRCWALLLNHPHTKPLNVFKNEYKNCYAKSCTFDMLNEISDVVVVTSSNEELTISLTALYILGAELYQVIVNSHQVSYNNLESLYQKFYNKPLKLSDYYINTARDFYLQFSLLFYVKFDRKNTVIVDRHVKDHIKTNVTNETAWAPPAPPEENEAHGGAKRKIVPPKPDTPPPTDAIPWKEIWSTPQPFREDTNLQIALPTPATPKHLSLSVLEDIYSPTSIFLSDNLLRQFVPSPAPHPNELPQPDKLLPKACFADDSADSGVNSRMENSSDNDQHSVHGQGARATWWSLWK